MAGKLTAFLNTLDWTAPYVDLYDTVYEFLADADAERNAAKTHEDWLLDDIYRDENYYVGKDDDDRAEWCERIVLRRLK